MTSKRMIVTSKLLSNTGLAQGGIGIIESMLAEMTCEIRREAGQDAVIIHRVEVVRASNRALKLIAECIV